MGRAKEWPRGQTESRILEESRLRASPEILWARRSTWRQISDRSTTRRVVGTSVRPSAHFGIWTPSISTAMARGRPHLSLLLLLLIAATANALHFYLDANEKRCFLEEIPSDTVVEGVPAFHALRLI